MQLRVAIVLFCAIGFAASFSPASPMRPANLHLKMCTRETPGDTGEIRKVQSGTSRRDWMGNVLKGIGAVAVGSSTLETMEVGMGLRAAPSIAEKAAEAGPMLVRNGAHVLEFIEKEALGVTNSVWTNIANNLAKAPFMK